MNLSDGRDQYHQSRRAQGVSDGSLRSQHGTLQRLLEVTGNIQVKNLGPRHIDMLWTAHTNWSAATYNRVRAELNMFFKWCRARGYMPRDNDPLEGVRRQKEIQPPALFVPPERFGELLDAAEVNSPRDRAIVAIGIYLFTRAGETVRIRWEHVDFEHKQVRIFRSKTGEWDDLPMCQELESELRRWRLSYGAIMETPVRQDWTVTPPYTRPTFKHTPGGLVMAVPATLRPFGVLTTPHRPVQRALRSLGYDAHREGGHTLRRSSATAWFNTLGSKEDKSARIVQAALGHKNFSTTQAYLRIENEKKERNDLLRGRRMFEEQKPAEVREIGEARSATDGV